MPRKIDGISYYTKAEIDQLVLAGYGASLANRNAVAIVIKAADWSTQSGGDLDGWRYATITHPNSPFARVTAFVGSNSFIQIADGTNDVQERISGVQLKLWLRDTISYDLLCLVVYA